MKGFQWGWLGRCGFIVGLLCAPIYPSLEAGDRRDVPIPLAIADDTWTATGNLNAPTAREFHTTVWTGREMIVWGGFNFYFGNFNSGGRYNPASNNWTAVGAANAPNARALHIGVWTGDQMIVWGGYNQGNDLDTGGRHDPRTNTWIATGITNAPAARESHTAVWTGSEMIVWGGLGCGSNCRLNSGGRYNPLTDTWTPTSFLNAPEARWNHTAVWTGNEMIIWGGTNQTVYLRTGARYNPATDTWTPLPDPGPSIPGRIGHSAVWTGNEMIVWGGADENFNVTNTGGRYNPATNSWIATGVSNGAPTLRGGHSAVWTGREMIIWGGLNQIDTFNDGKRYDPVTGSWKPMTTVNAPLARFEHTAIWTGNEMIVWGGNDEAGYQLDTGGKYSAQPSTPLLQSAVSRKTHGNAGNFDVDLLLSGTPGVECRSGGANGDYTLVLTFLANVSISGSPQASVTSGMGMIGRGGVNDGGAVLTSGNTVTIPLTNVANAQTIAVTLNNVNGASNVTVPMSVLAGDVTGNRVVNASDIGLIKAQSGQAISGSNFSADLNADGSINATDVSLVKASSGTGLPNKKSGR